MHLHFGHRAINQRMGPTRQPHNADDFVHISIRRDEGCQILPDTLGLLVDEFDAGAEQSGAGTANSPT